MCNCLTHRDPGGPMKEMKKRQRLSSQDVAKIREDVANGQNPHYVRESRRTSDIVINLKE